jgi:hypothetical protein
MSSSAVMRLPIKPTPDVALAIVDQLDEKGFSEVAEAIRARARERACDAWDRMRRSARRAGLRRADFEKALREVRLRKRGRHAATARRP